MVDEAKLSIKLIFITFDYFFDCISICFPLKTLLDKVDEVRMELENKSSTKQIQKTKTCGTLKPQQKKPVHQLCMYGIPKIKAKTSQRPTQSKLKAKTTKSVSFFCKTFFLISLLLYILKRYK